MNSQREPGLYLDIPNAAYHGGQGLSNSGLRNLAKSPFHFYSRHMDPNRPPVVAKAGQLEGNLAHCAVLEPLEFQKRYVIGPKVNKNTNVWRDFVAEHSGQEVISAEQADVAHAQARSLRSLPDVAELLSSGFAEASAFWYEDVVDADSGEVVQVLCRVRPDWVHPVGDDGVILLDVKTASDASPWEFAKQIRRKAYHCQDAFYRRGYAKATGKKVHAFVFAAVESEWPFAASAVMLQDSDVEDGDSINERLLKLYVKCLSTNTWPSYTPNIVPVSIPNFKD